MMTNHAAFRMPDGGPIHDGCFLTAIPGLETVPEVDVPVVAMPTQFEARRPTGGVNGSNRELGDDDHRDFWDD